MLIAAFTLSACTSGQSQSSRAPTGVPTPRQPATPDARARTSTGTSAGSHSTPTHLAPRTGSAAEAQRAFDAMTERARVGQLLMVDCPSTGVSAATRRAIEQDQVGAVILDGNSQAGLAATRTVTARLRELAPQRVGLFIATDQEGGIVQRLRGPGFSAIPAAVAQGSTDPGALEGVARTWGQELHEAGVNLDLAPVLDTVPIGAHTNPPIGDLDREYGRSPGTVTLHGLAVVRGLSEAGVDVSVKHFPGLGRVSGNTDTTSGVTDSSTTRGDAYLAPFRAAVHARVPFVMMSTAIYSRMDAGTPAAFSRKIVTGLLRTGLGFRGVVISDDVGAAQQVARYSPGARAVSFIAAGGDVVLTVVADQAAEMTEALLGKAKREPSFKRLVDAAALRVLQAKQARGLL